jgi:hypothetical protein
MIELIRNCSHGSEIATYIVTDINSRKKILKASTSSSGIKNLKNEFEGWNWYKEIRYPLYKEPLCRVVQQKEKYLKIEIQFIEGIKADYRKGIKNNSELLKMIIKHYCKTWPFNKYEYSPLHGDLSIDNIIYNSNGINFIDWEHFNLKGAPWGFDALYLLFETLWFSMKSRAKPNVDEVNIIKQNLDVLNSDGKLESKLLISPLTSIKEFINENYSIWGEQLQLFRKKLPVLEFDEQQITNIEKLILS